MIELRPTCFHRNCCIGRLDCDETEAVNPDLLDNIWTIHALKQCAVIWKNEMSNDDVADSNNGKIE